MSYIDSPHEKQSGAHRLDLLREAGQQRLLAHLPPSASSCEGEERNYVLLKHRSGVASLINDAVGTPTRPVAAFTPISADIDRRRSSRFPRPF